MAKVAEAQEEAQEVEEEVEEEVDGVAEIQEEALGKEQRDMGRQIQMQLEWHQEAAHGQQADGWLTFLRMPLHRAPLRMPLDRAPPSSSPEVQMAHRWKRSRMKDPQPWLKVQMAQTWKMWMQKQPSR